MFDAIRQCITASNVMGFNKPESYRTLSHKDAFRLATLGGSEGKRVRNNINMRTMCTFVKLISIYLSVFLKKNYCLLLSLITFLVLGLSDRIGNFEVRVIC